MSGLVAIISSKSVVPVVSLICQSLLMYTLFSLLSQVLQNFFDWASGNSFSSDTQILQFLCLLLYAVQMDHLSLACVLRSSNISVFLDISGISGMLGITHFVGFLLGSCRSSLLLKGIIMVASVFQVPWFEVVHLKQPSSVF